MTTEQNTTPESTEKLKDVKEVIAYLAEQFPKCFTIEGDAQPLKIGLFQELAERLDGDDKVSKTQLRQAIRRYTNSWRYLRGSKAGAVRVDLDGNDCGALEQEHIEHAEKTLKESQERAKEVRQEKAAAERKAKRPAKKPRPARAEQAAKAKPSKLKKETEQRNSKPLEKVSADKLVVNMQVLVTLGKTPAKGTVTDVNKGDVMVRLESGLTVKVKADHIRV
ncbi:RNA chaperone ProQ [Ferrimonas lipolytica]|uniref:RNA chaperone ProQ n=1 Tax=Ferrimonas lipolytica TaxID=2724191 RepID=A0A6H1UEB6_9GAMM|nr:RNA chaperone ProQ [Ferrimonas lipolytica]QIZ76556.1 RNA chaperone ProQ [Ferrimonas lipolytica]